MYNPPFNNIVSIASNVTLRNKTINLVSTAAARTLTLPAPRVGLYIVVKDDTGSGGTNNITINPASGTIDGAGSYTINSSYGVVTITSDGTNYFALASLGTLAIGAAVGAATVGSLLFIGTGPVLSQDNSNLFWDNSTKRLGIGTNTPGSLLDLKASGLAQINMNSTGNTVALNFQRATTDRFSMGVNDGGPGGSQGLFWYGSSAAAYAGGIDVNNNWYMTKSLFFTGGTAGGSIARIGILIKATAGGTYTSVAGDEIWANSGGGAFTINMPATPVAGWRVRIADYGGNWATNNVTVGRNGSNINGSATDFTLNVNNGWAEFVYVDSTQGWRVLS